MQTLPTLTGIFWVHLDQSTALQKTTINRKCGSEKPLVSPTDATNWTSPFL